jgi:hypothetical protein
MRVNAATVKVRCTFCGRLVGRNALTWRPAAHKLTEENAPGGLCGDPGDWCPGAKAGN